MIILSIVTYFAGLSNIKRVQYFAIFICASALIFYKYTIFLTSSLIGLFDPAIASQLTRELTDSVLPSAPPLAISFFVLNLFTTLWMSHGRIKNQSVRQAILRSSLCFGQQWLLVPLSDMNNFFRPWIKEVNL
jgi:hypothetical protein